MAAVLAKYELATDPTEYADMPDARSELRDAATALAGRAAAAGYDALDRPAVDALLSQGAQLADPSGALPGPQLAMLAQGRPLDDSVLAGLTSDAAAVKEWLLNRLDSDPTLADCELRSQVRAVSVTGGTSSRSPRPCVPWAGLGRRSPSCSSGS